METVLLFARHGRKQTAAGGATQRGNDGERRKAQKVFHVVRGPNGIVHVIEITRERYSEHHRKERCEQNSLPALRRYGTLRPRGVVDDVYVVGRARENYVVLLGPLQQAVKQSLVSFDFLLNDAVVNGRFILGQDFTALLIKSCRGALVPFAATAGSRFRGSS